MQLIFLLAVAMAVLGLAGAWAPKAAESNAVRMACQAVANADLQEIAVSLRAGAYDDDDDDDDDDEYDDDDDDDDDDDEHGCVQEVETLEEFQEILEEAGDSLVRDAPRP